MGHRVYTGGTFDCFHAGHANFLRQCRALAGAGGVVVVSLNPDWFIEKFKGKPPIISYQERALVLEAVKYVDLVVPNTGGPDSKPAIWKIRPDIVAVGDDWASRDYAGQMGWNPQFLQDNGIELIYLPRYEGISTTEIRERLAG